MDDFSEDPKTYEEALAKLYKVGDYIHSLNQPLTTLFGQLDLLNMRLEGTEYHENLKKAMAQTDRVTDILTTIAREYPRGPE